MSEPDLTQRDIESIIEIIKSAPDVADFSLKYGKTEIRISREAHAGAERHAPVAPVRPAPAPVEPPKPGATAATGGGAAMLAPDEFTIDAPMVGTFYRAPAPGETPFVAEGQQVEGDTVLCIIEVMKLMNSISAKRRGRVKRILVADGEPVEFGQPLMVLEAVD